MEFGLGILRLSPSEFWGMTGLEFQAACRGHLSTLADRDSVAPLTSDEFEKMQYTLDI